MLRQISISLGVTLVVVCVVLVYFLSQDDNAPQPRPGGAPRPEITDSPPAPEPGSTAHGPKREDVQGPARRTPAAGGAAVFGRVVAEETLAPIAGAQVKIAADIPASSLERTVWLRADQSNKEGRFRFDRLPAALYRLQVSAPGRLNQSEVGVAVTDEEIVIPMVASADIPCRVLVDTGDDEVPLPDRRVSLELPGEVWSLETQTDANGILLLAGISGAELAGDFRRIEVIVEGHADPLLERSVEEDEISWYGWTCQGVRLENRLYGPIRPPSSD